MKTAKTSITYDEDTTVAGELTSGTIILNFVDKITYPTTATTENSKPYSNSEAIITGATYLKESTGQTTIDYVMYSNSQSEVSMTMSITKATGDFAQYNKGTYRVCT